MFTSTSELIVLIEANGLILLANQASAAWLNRSTEAVSGENLFQLLTPFGIPIREWVYRAVGKKVIYEAEASFGERFARLRLIPIVEAAQVTRLIVIGQDVTEQKRVEEQVREFTDQMEQKVRQRTAQLEALNQKLLRDKRRAELLANFSKLLMQDTQDYNQLLENITAQLSDLIGDTCLIAVFTLDLISLEVRAIMDRDLESLPRQREELLHRAIKVEGNPIANAILRGERFSATDITKERGAALLPLEIATLLGEHGIKTLEVFPLHIGEHPLGMLGLARESGNPYSEEDLSFVSSLTSFLALAIHNASLFDQLTESQSQLRGLSKQLVHIQENQYSRLAAEVHDHVGQDITAININLGILRGMLPASTPIDVFSRIADTEQLVTEIVKRLRTTIAEFRPPVLDQYGLTATLYWYSEQYHQRTKIPISINDRHMKDVRLPAETEIALFRIAQEALNNVAKHANATQVDIELIEGIDYLIMAITDNGIGFDLNSQGLLFPEQWGLTLMQERARSINGKLILRSVPEKGTQIIVRVERAA